MEEGKSLFLFSKYQRYFLVSCGSLLLTNKIYITNVRKEMA